jgi:hypothetical protein
MANDTEHFARQLQNLTIKSYADIGAMGEAAAELTKEAFMVNALHHMLDEIDNRKRELANRLMGALPAHLAHPSINATPVMPPVEDQSEEAELTRIIANLRRASAEAAE